MESRSTARQCDTSKQVQFQGLSTLGLTIRFVTLQAGAKIKQAIEKKSSQSENVCASQGLLIIVVWKNSTHLKAFKMSKSS